MLATLSLPASLYSGAKFSSLDNTSVFLRGRPGPGTAQWDMPRVVDGFYHSYLNVPTIVLAAPK